MTVIIKVQLDLWRSDCIASIGTDEKRNELQIVPINCSDSVDYQWEEKAEFVEETKRITQEWSDSVAPRG